MWLYQPLHAPPVTNCTLFCPCVYHLPVNPSPAPHSAIRVVNIRGEQVGHIKREVAAQVRH